MSARHVLSIEDLSASEIRTLLREAKRFKQNRRLGSTLLAGKVVALVFQKPSMRTRVAFEVAVTHLGGSVISLGQEDIQLGQREPIKDVARVLSRYVDAIVVRTFAHQDAKEFAKYARVPVINGLSDLAHPCQALADVFTLEEHFGRLQGLKVSYVGDGNNVLHSLMQVCGMLGIDLSVATPKAYRPHPSLWASAVSQANTRHASLTWSSDPRKAIQEAVVVYTDVWVSMGQEREQSTRRQAFHGYQLNDALLKHAAPGCRVMHCLPAHRGEEITEEMIDGSRSLIFEQAENRLHVQKALLAMLLGRKSAS